MDNGGCVGSVGGYGLSKTSSPAYSKVTMAPRPSKTFLSFSASSFGKFSLRTFGNDSTNFFA